MAVLNQLLPRSPFLYELPRTYSPDMLVPARLYADSVLFAQAAQDRSLEQLANMACLPGIVRYALAMPDIHQGYGFPIGGVVATALPDGVLSPGGVGYDINCGVRVISTGLPARVVHKKLEQLMDGLFSAVAVGAGSGGGLALNSKELDAVLASGISWCVKKGYSSPEEQAHTEDKGHLQDADPDAVSPRARERGLDQLGTLGAGNHFIEVDRVDHIYDEEAARAMRLEPDTVCIWVHCGSRGLGHQVCTDAVRTMQVAVSRYGIRLPDRELACAPFNSPEAREYWQAMNCAANYAWANRQIITHAIRGVLERVFAAESSLNVGLVYDVCHNIAKKETHLVDDLPRSLCVHRKGATRAFGPGCEDVPADYQHIGQPVLVPGNMSSGSFVMVGTQQAMEETFGSCCHGAGRVMSRTAARKTVHADALRRQLDERGISLRAGSSKGLAEEAPQAYKDLDRVVGVAEQAGLARLVARTLPMGVIKG